MMGPAERCPSRNPLHAGALVKLCTALNYCLEQIGAALCACLYAICTGIARVCTAIANGIGYVCGKIGRCFGVVCGALRDTIFIPLYNCLVWICWKIYDGRRSAWIGCPSTPVEDSSAQVLLRRRCDIQIPLEANRSVLLCGLRKRDGASLQYNFVRRRGGRRHHRLRGQCCV